MNQEIDLSDVSIVVLSHNRLGAVSRNVAMLAGTAAGTRCELIVVDNASTDGSAEAIRDTLASTSNIQIIENPTNLGVAAGRNAGWAVARRDYILNLDDDISAAPRDIARMAEVLRRNRLVGAVAPIIVDFTTGAVQYSYGDAEVEIANFQGACHMVRRELIRQIGMNDEKCLFGGEELDLSIRIRAAGQVVLFTPLARVEHDHHERQGGEARSRRSRWVYNFTRVYHKHFPFDFAMTLSLRTLASHLVAGTRLFGPLFGVTLFREAVRGMREGRRSRHVVPAAVVEFFRDPDLRPEFGNVPLARKILRRLSSPISTRRAQP